MPAQRLLLPGMSSILLRFCTLRWSECLGDCTLQVWTFLVSDATFKTSATGSGSTVSAPEVHVDKVKIIAVREISCMLSSACFLVTTGACLESPPSWKTLLTTLTVKTLQAAVV